MASGGWRARGLGQDIGNRDRARCDSVGMRYNVSNSEKDCLKSRNTWDVRPLSNLRCCAKSDLRKDPLQENTIHNPPKPNRRIPPGIV